MALLPEVKDSAADFVFDVLETPLHNLTQSNNTDYARRFPPRFWQERFESHRLLENVASGEIPAQTQIGEAPRADDNMPIPISRKRTLKDHVILFKTHLRRSILSKFRNKGTLYSTILEAPLLAFLIGLTLRASEEGSYDFGASTNLIEYLFLSVTVGMFLGLTNSATEILRDKPILRRERNHRYGTGIYVIAKFSTLALLAIIQSGIYIAIGNYMLEIEGMFFYHWVWMSLTAIVGTAMALLISSIVNTERAALSAVPLLLVPQLLLAGALVKFEDMNRGLFQGGEKAREEGVAAYHDSIAVVRKGLDAYRPEKLEKMSPEQFSDLRVASSKKMRKLFEDAGTTLPEGVEFGFEKYAESSVKIAATPKLNYQLEASQWLLSQLAGVKPSALVNIVRTPLPIESGNAAAAPAPAPPENLIIPPIPFG